TVLFSSHILSEVEALCERVVVIARGRIVGEGTPAELAARIGGRQRGVVCGGGPAGGGGGGAAGVPGGGRRGGGPGALVRGGGGATAISPASPARPCSALGSDCSSCARSLSTSRRSSST